MLAYLHMAQGAPFCTELKRLVIRAAHIWITILHPSLCGSTLAFTQKVQNVVSLSTILHISGHTCEICALQNSILCLSFQMCAYYQQAHLYPFPCAYSGILYHFEDNMTS